MRSVKHFSYPQKQKKNYILIMTSKQFSYREKTLHFFFSGQFSGRFLMEKFVFTQTNLFCIKIKVIHIYL